MLYLIATPLGNLRDISINAILALNKSDVILCEDTRVTKKLLDLLSKDEIIKNIFDGIKIESVCAKKFISFHSHNEYDFLKNIDKSFFENKTISFCSDAGMPCISDPGASLINFARSNKIKYEIINGGSSFALAYAYCALEGDFKFISFLPQKREKKIEHLKNIANDLAHSHIIMFESPHRLLDTLNLINEILPNINIYAYKEMTKMYFKEYIGTAQILLESIKNTKGEWCLVLSKYNDENNEKIKTLNLNKDDILNLNISNKEKSKMLSKITNKNTKEWYEILEKNKK